MGSGMTKYHSADTYYKRRRDTKDIDSCFSKEYSEYWKTDDRRLRNENFGMDKNDYRFSSGCYDSPLRDKRRKMGTFVSSFSQDENQKKMSIFSTSTNFSQRSK